MTPLRYITGRKTPRNTARRQNKTKQKTKIAHVLTVRLHYPMHVGLTKVRASPGAASASAPLSTPRCHLPPGAILRSSHPVPSSLTHTLRASVLCPCAGPRRRPRDFSVGSPPTTSPVDLLAWVLPPAAQTCRLRFDSLESP